MLKADPTVGFEIMGLAVAPAARRRGIGRLLLDNADRIAAGDGYRAVQVAAIADNTAMLCLLLTAGYLPIRLDPRARADMADMMVLRKGLPTPSSEGPNRPS